MPELKPLTPCCNLNPLTESHCQAKASLYPPRVRAESKAAVHVYAEQSEAVVALAAQLLPTATLALEATLRRLLLDGIQHSGQVRVRVVP